MKRILLVLIFLFLFLPGSVLATIGVGVGSGKIQVESKLKPGIIYELPPLTVLNTGDEQSDYEVTIEYHEKQSQLRPSRSWFSFVPQKFSLDPGKSQIVNIKLNLPVMTEPGDYFAYLEGHPVKKTQSGNTSVGVAAAAKLYFTVIPGNVFEGIYYKGLSIWKVYSPWPQGFLALVAMYFLIRVFKRFFNIQIGLKNQPGRESDRNSEVKKE